MLVESDLYPGFSVVEFRQSQKPFHEIISPEIAEHPRRLRVLITTIAWSSRGHMIALGV